MRKRLNCGCQNFEETSIKIDVIGVAGSRSRVETQTPIKTDNALSIFTGGGLIPAHPVVPERKDDQEKMGDQQNNQSTARQFAHLNYHPERFVPPLALLKRGQRQRAIGGWTPSIGS